MKRKYLNRMIGKETVVHTTDDQSIRGILTVVATDALVLEAAQHLGQANAVDVSGRAVVSRDKFSWAQEL